jgi:acyl-CoA hydrolase
MRDSDITLRFLAAPFDVGVTGKVPGGRVLEWIDKAGYAVAVAWSQKYCVTAYVGNVHFSKPILAGHLVEVRARVVRTGRSSMTILSDVHAVDVRTGERWETCRCAMVFVGTDKEGKPVPVPTFEPSTAEKRKLWDDAETLAGSRKRIEGQMAGQVYTDAGQGERITLRFLARPTDVNWGGKVHGGTVMGWIDEAAGACAARWTGGESIAVYAGGVRFYRPMLIGDLVEVEARLLHTDEQQMHISVHVRSGDVRTGELNLTTHCLIVLVGLDADARPTSVRQWEPSTEEDIALDKHAQDMQESRVAAHHAELFVFA